MSSFLNTLFVILFIFYIFPISISLENSANENKDNEQKNLFHNFDFGNLIWLDETNITAEIEKNDLLVFFYVNWCKYSYEFMPEFIKVSNYAKKNNLSVKFGKMDASKNPKIAEKYKIISVPAIFLFLNGEYYIFNLERTKENLLEFIDKIKNSITEVETLSEINEIIESSPLVALCTLKNMNKILYRSFEDFSKKELNIKFVLCTSDECKKEFYEDVILFKKFDEKKNIFTRDVGRIAYADINSVKDFIVSFSVETGVLMNENILNMANKYKRSVLLYFRDSNNIEQTKNDKIIKEIGMELRKEKIYTALSDIRGLPFYETLATSFSIKKEDLPALVLYDLKNAESEDKIHSYRLPTVTSEQLNKEFINQFINQENNQNKEISENTFEDADPDNTLTNYDVTGLKRITDKNYDSDVVKKDKKVVLTIIDGTIFLPETKAILDIMKNLAKKYIKEDITFAYLDQSKYQIKNIDFNGDIPPMVLLFVDKDSYHKNVIKMHHPNFEQIKEEQVIEFINNAFKIKSNNEEL